MSKIGTTIKVYLIWFVVNFIITTIPIMVTKLFPSVNLADLFSSFLMFIYTLLILSVVGLYFHWRTESPPFSFADVSFWFTMSVIIAIIVIFPVYNLVSDVKQFINSHIQPVTISLAVTGIVLTFLLHSPILSKQIHVLVDRKRIWENPNQIRKDVTKMKREIEQENSQ